MDARLQAGADLILAEYSENGLARALLNFIDSFIAYRSDGDAPDLRENWATVKGLRELLGPKGIVGLPTPFGTTDE